VNFFLRNDSVENKSFETNTKSLSSWNYVISRVLWPGKNESGASDRAEVIVEKLTPKR